MADKVNYCRKPGYGEFGMNWCAAPRFKDQEECEHHKKSSVSNLCMHFRRNIDRHCDSLPAQKGSTVATAEEKAMRVRTEKEREKKEEEDLAKTNLSKEGTKGYKGEAMEQVKRMYEKWGKAKR